MIRVQEGRDRRGGGRNQARAGPAAAGPPTLDWLRAQLPQGGTLPDDVWRSRHRGVVMLLWFHVPALMVFALARGTTRAHAVAEAAIVAIPALAAQRSIGRRRESTVFASVGLMTASAVLVHLSGGVIEAHFHFFVMVGVVVLYQDWLPFLVAIGFVILHHGIMGALWPRSVFNHPDALRHPWIWAGIHGVSILAMSAVGIATWRLNEALQRATLDREAKLAEAQRLARLGSWEYDRATGKAFWSAGVQRLFDLPPQWEHTMEEFLSLVHPDDRPAIEEAFDTVGSRALGFTVDFRARMEDGSLRWFSLRGDIDRDEVGRALNRMHGTCQDVTDAKAAEEVVGQARDAALTASRVKSEFLATMSHEIRTPMNGVIGLTGLLLDSDLSEMQRHHAEGVRASGEALLGIINDILDFSKIEAGKLELETVDFDLGQALEDVAALVAESARAKELELVAYCRPEVPVAVRGDVGRLRQILLNFATNAVKFTASGEVLLRAGLDAEPTPDGVVVRLEVADTGIGIDPAVVDRLFEPFSQADASTTRRYGGTGLGLAICRRLADAMGGSIGVDSRVGQGSTFWIRLPLKYASEAIAPPRPATHALDGCRALIVDDNQTNRDVLVAQLRAWDVAADVAADAFGGLDLLRASAAAAKPYDVGLLDMTMPGMDGIELARIIQADPALSSVQLVLLSSVSVDAETAAASGFVARLVKPVRLSSLYDALVRAATPGPGAVAPRPARTGAPVGSRGTVLIVEDHAINQEVAKGIVAKLGYASDVAGNGAEALRALELRSYDAVLMDVHMPEMDGYEATAQIRRREAGRSHVPIIAMTAGARVEDQARCLAAEMDDYLSKPVKEHDLEVVLDRWVAGRSASPQAPLSPDPPGPAELDGVIDEAQVEGLRRLAHQSGDAGLLRGFVERYLHQAAGQLAELREAGERGDTGALRALAHGLKGTSATMGLVGVASAAATVEDASARGELSAQDAIDRVFVEFERATAALRALAADTH